MNEILIHLALVWIVFTLLYLVAITHKIRKMLEKEREA